MSPYSRAENYRLDLNSKGAKVISAAIITIVLGIGLILSPLYTAPSILVIVLAFFVWINPFTGLILYVLSFILPSGYNITFGVFIITSISWYAKSLSRRGNKKVLIKSPLNWMILGLFLSALIPVFFADGVLENYLDNPKEPFLLLGYGLGAIIIMNMIDSNKRINSIIWTITIVGVVVGLISVYQYFASPYIDYSYTYQAINTTISDPVFGDMRRATSLFGDAPTTGYFLQTIFFVCLAALFGMENRREKFFFLISSILIAFGIYATLSRSVWLTFIITYIYWKVKRGIKLKEILTVVLLIPIVYFSFQEKINQRIYQTFVEKDFKQDELYQQWAEIKRFIDSPLIGTGIETKSRFEAVKPYLEEEGFFYYVDYDEDKELSYLNMFTTESQYTSVFFYTGIAVQLGIFGLILILLVIGYTWIDLTKAEVITKSRECYRLYNIIILGLKASFFSQLIHLIRGSPTYKLFWLMVGVSLAFSYFIKTNSTKLPTKIDI